MKAERDGNQENNDVSGSGDNLDVAARGLNRLHLNNTGLSPIQLGSGEDIVKKGLEALANMSQEELTKLIELQRVEK